MPLKIESEPSARPRWSVSEEEPRRESAHRLSREDFESLIDTRSIEAHFQPIFSAKDGTVYGFEALARPSFRGTRLDVGQVFRRATELDLLAHLDLLCFTTALRRALSLAVDGTRALLFVNVCPESLVAPLGGVGGLDFVLEESGFPRERIVLEITEEYAIRDYTLFSSVMSEYRRRGYKIAIDDFGAGYGGLKMLSMIEPDFVKIDRHFISHMDKALVRYNLVDLIATACHRMGINVVAEGVEREEEMRLLSGMGIDFLQGYYLAKPGPNLHSESSVPSVAQVSEAGDGQASIIGDIAACVRPTAAEATTLDIFQRFMKEPDLIGLPVVTGDRVVGMLNRHVFLEKKLLGNLGYGFALHAGKNASALAKDHPFLEVDFNQNLEEISRKIQSLGEELHSQDICITRNGKYYGTVTVVELLKAITQRNLSLAKMANPLTGLPGNLFIQAEIEKRIAQNLYFDVSYLDIDNFKPYNDHYGFGRGDTVLARLAEIVKVAVGALGDSSSFVGHIGGDDFIVVSRPQQTRAICECVIAEFEAERREFHGEEDLQRGSFSSTNRKGEVETFGLLSLSIGTVSNEVQKVSSFAQLASLASEVKCAAKQIHGSALVVDRRLGE